MLYFWNNRYRVVALLLYRMGGGAMSTYQVLTLLFVFGTFLLALLAYIDKKQQKNYPVLVKQGSLLPKGNSFEDNCLGRAVIPFCNTIISLLSKKVKHMAHNVLHQSIAMSNILNPKKDTAIINIRLIFIQCGLQISPIPSLQTQPLFPWAPGLCILSFHLPGSIQYGLRHEVQAHLLCTTSYPKRVL